MKIDWAAKLTSRKFWIAVCGLVSGLLMAFRADEKTIENITGIIMAGASVLAYCIGEGLADAAGAKTDTYLVDEEAHPPESDPLEDDLK